MLYFKEMEELRSLFEYSRRCPIWMWRIAVVFFFLIFLKSKVLCEICFGEPCFYLHICLRSYSFPINCIKQQQQQKKTRKTTKPKCTFHTGVQSFQFQVFLITHFYRSYSKTYSIYIDINVDSIDIIFLKIVGKNSKVAKILLT